MGFAMRDATTGGKKLPLYLNTRTMTSHIFFGPYVLFPM